MGVSRIDSIPKHVEDQFPAIREEYIAAGLNTDEADWAGSWEAIKRCYKYSDLKEPSRYVPVQNLMTLAIAAPMADWILEPGKQLGRRRKQKAAKDDRIARLIEAACDSFEQAKMLSAEVMDAVLAACPETTKGQVEDLVANHGPKIKEHIRGNWYSYIGGCWWLSWQAYLKVFRLCDLELPGDLWDRADWFEKAQRASGWWWPHSDFVMVCDRPKAIHVERVGTENPFTLRLHKVGSPALQYRDDWALWILHGIEVEQWMAEGDPREWTKEQVLEVQNVDQRREVLARYGKDRLWGDAKILDRQGDYELGVLNITGTPRVALHMKNPSLGCYHVEYVDPGCKTVQEAKNDRASRLKTKFGDWNPSIVT